MKSRYIGVVASVAVVGLLSLSACATKDDIAKAVDPVNAKTQATADQLAKTQSDLASTQASTQTAIATQGSQINQIGGQVNQLNGQVGQLNGQVSQIGSTAQQALDRAKAAGVLAEGKFLYSVVLSDDSIKFPAGGDKLSPEAMARLDELVTRLKTENHNVYLEIQGYTDSTGSAAANQALGQQRADAVRRYLSSKGVPLNRISTISYGAENPAAPNKTKTGRAQNRRVVIQVLS